MLETCELLDSLNDRQYAERMLSTTQHLDVLIFALSLLEVCCKLVAFGAVAAPTSYLRDGWNLLDLGLILATGAMLHAKRMGRLRGIGTISAPTFAIASDGYMDG